MRRLLALAVVAGLLTGCSGDPYEEYCDTVVEHQAPSRIVLEGKNETVNATDSITVEPHGAGSRVTYVADFDFKGIAKFIAPLMSPALKKLGDDAKKGMEEALAKL